MTSKEYIKAKLEYLIRYEPSLSFDIDMFEQVLKDLDSLEVLESNNEKVIKDSVKLINKNLELQQRLEALEKENKELKEIIEIRKQMNINLIDFSTKLKQENEKLKKAIEILKDYIAVSTRRNEKFEYIPCIYSFGLNKDISQQEYELLKEVLGDERN